MLCFVLEKFYDDASQYPPAMHGYIEIKAKRADKAKASGQPKAEAILEQTEPETTEQSETGQEMNNYCGKTPFQADRFF